MTRRPGRAAATLLAVASSAYMSFQNASVFASAAFGFAPLPASLFGRVDTRLHAAAAAKPMELWIDARQDVRGDAAVPPSRLSEADAVILGPDDPPPPSPSAAAHPALASASTNLAYYNLVDRPPRPGMGGIIPPLLFRDDRPVGAVVDFSDPSGQDEALGLVGSVEWILAECNADSDFYRSPDREWFMIPAENLISACQGTGTKIVAYVQRAGDVGGLSRALELGVDALCIEALADEELWAAALEARQERSQHYSADNNYKDDDAAATAQPSILQGRCRRLQVSGSKSSVLADRVCLDFVQSLKSTEGCWIGSSAKLTALVLCEAAESAYAPSMAFRVNAGPVHSYVVLGDGKSTKYLSELRAGDEVLVYNVETGVQRSVAVGRVEVEVQPCVMIGLCVEGGLSNGNDDDGNKLDGQLFLQQTETVRLGQSLGAGSFVRVTDLVGEGDGDDVLLRAMSFGTHVGRAYSGKVIEQ